jgi:cytidylate kinase
VSKQNEVPSGPAGVEPPLIVAIDGPSGAGKTTVARAVAARLQVPYLETGAMYRAVGLKVLECKVDAEDQSAVESLAQSMDLALVLRGQRIEVHLDGQPTGSRANTLEVSEMTSKVSAYPGVRRRMVALQRQGGREHGGVLEGRDIGTRVFPETPYKFFLDASPEVRARRRWRQLRETGRREVSEASVLREVKERDRRDSTRAESPLTRDASYTVVDSSTRTVDEVIDSIVKEVLARAEQESRR